MSVDCEDSWKSSCPSLLEKINSASELYISGWAILVVGSLGLLGNILSCTWLLTSGYYRLPPTFSSLLQWLTAIDSLLILLLMATFAIPQVSLHYREIIFPEAGPILLPVTSVLITASVYCVVVLTIERYTDTCRTRRTTSCNVAQECILPVLAFAAVFNIPRFLEFKTAYIQTAHRGQEAYVGSTSFRDDPDYGLYVLTSNLLVMGVIPLALLVTFTCLVYRHLAKNSQDDRKARCGYSLLLSTVAVLIVCHSPRIGLSLFEICSAVSWRDIPMGHYWVVDLSHLLLVIQAASHLPLLLLQGRPEAKGSLIPWVLPNILKVIKTTNLSLPSPPV